MFIKPTIGRVVWFYNRPGADQPCAAIVCYVHSDRLVNLAVFDQNGDTHSYCSVYLVQEGEEAPDEIYAEWMPYQKGQAAKTEALESKLVGS